MDYLIDTETKKVIAGTNDTEFIPEDGQKVVEGEERDDLQNLYYDEGDGFYIDENKIIVTSRNVFEVFQQRFFEWEGSLPDALDEFDDLLNNYPSLDRALRNGNFEVIRQRVSKAVNENNLAKDKGDNLLKLIEDK